MCVDIMSILGLCPTQKQHPVFCNAISQDLLFRQGLDRGIVVDVAQREAGRVTVQVVKT